MAVDIAPELYKKIINTFDDLRTNDKRCEMLREKFRTGKATYNEAHEYAQIIGKHMSDSMLEHLNENILPDGKMYYNIAEKTVGKALYLDAQMISEAAVQAQQAMNIASGLGLIAQPAKINADRIRGIVDKVSSYATFEEGRWVLDEPIINFSQSVVDDTIKHNAEFQYKAGLKPKIKRQVVAGCCKWCSALSGSYDYPGVPEDVYRRHERCRCLTLYVSADKKQDVWSKKEYDAEKDARIEAIKKLNIKENEIQKLRNNLPRNYIDERNLGELISAEELKKIKKYARQNQVQIGELHSPNGGFDLYRGNPKILYGLIDEVNEQMNSPMFPKSVKSIILKYDNILGYEINGKMDMSMIDIDAFAETKGKTITLNKFMFDDTGFMEKFLNQNFQERFFVGEDNRAIISHEIGHIIDKNTPKLRERIINVLQQEAKKQNKKLQEYLIENISGYAETKSKDGTLIELVAEINSLLKTDPQNSIIIRLKERGILK